MAELDDCTNLKQRIQHIVTEEIAPMLQMDGGGIEVISIQEGVVQVRLLGTCAGCPSTVRAIIMGIEEELRQRVPEVDYLEAIP
jgi:Fe-S cluster biogenesis protein NfuA